jgi:hypothetical protein
VDSRKSSIPSSFWTIIEAVGSADPGFENHAANSKDEIQVLLARWQRWTPGGHVRTNLEFGLHKEWDGQNVAPEIIIG